MRKCEVRRLRTRRLRRSVRNAARVRGQAQAGRDPRSAAIRRAPARHHSWAQRADGESARFRRGDRAAQALQFRETDRGGDITYHGPGQIVGYPIFDLREWKRDVAAYVRAMEQAIIDALAEFGIEGGREPGATGVWTDGRKDMRHRCAHQPLGNVSRLRSESHNRSELFSIHSPLWTHQTGDIHAGLGPRWLRGADVEAALTREFSKQFDFEMIEIAEPALVTERTI